MGEAETYSEDARPDQVWELRLACVAIAAIQPNGWCSAKP
ncbi:hypothetical protein APY04_1923 [Hyphomicrobium sulfonivorans]|uniref:Uncharacterized protein n=1 Tax=Hyphomicrobium sulfonivorans TaxID=121290 RepID=A0A109BEW8_HYPSL|nr:hypothetical protein APY04_1923 [Hyphomicrobium sulfonivorans]